MSILLAIKSLKTTNQTAKTVQTLLSQHRNITINWIKAHNGHLGNEKADQLAKRDTIGGTSFSLQKSVIFLKKTLTQLSLEPRQREMEEGTTGRYTFDAVSSGPGAKFYSQLDMAHFLATSKDSDWLFRTAVHVGTPFHYATACPLTVSFHSKTPSAIHKLPWRRNLVSNPHGRRRLKILMEFIRTNA
ncbi:hypothetical protein AVEN_275773-1 [Araneus ventricosus]|uniref:RNase H type-1 domain-containing protein n=1 Tax=Araneus ventricosus TaxID=182803 RepID=A0A4Y2HEL8_ARAVE|nr:hypothetical protein AVEN_275773-1 [Araneus ventricosus]